MTLVKWTKPSSNGQLNKQLTYRSPFRDLLQDFFPEEVIAPGPQFTPAANILDAEKEYYIELAVPGFDKADFKIELNHQILSVSGNRQEKETTTGNPAHVEFSKLSFKRKFTLPDYVDQDAIKAVYENGILKISIPKKPGAIARTISVF